jgi:hypothetical protein
VFAITLTGAVVLALFASRDLASWTERLGDTPVVLAAQKIAAEWDQDMATFGLTRPHEVLRDSFRRLLDASW